MIILWIIYRPKSQDCRFIALLTWNDSYFDKTFKYATNADMLIHIIFLHTFVHRRESVRGFIVHFVVFFHTESGIMLLITMY